MVEVTRPEGASLPVDPTTQGFPGPPEAASWPNWRELLGRYERWLRVAVDVLVLAACTGFVLLQLGPTDLVSNTTPAGGDMGAHVWGPAFLRDELLPDFQLAGWAPDWYAGFAAYQFYMVVPMLAIVALDVGVVDLASIPGVLLAVVTAGVVGVAAGMWSDRRWRYVAVGVPIAAFFLFSLPYGVAFKMVAISGPLSLPLAAYAFGRLANVRFPGPNLLAVGTLPYLFYQGYSIYGGNLPSMLAGEFAFSMSLSLALLFLGVVLRGLETGRYRALAAVLLALTGLCHIIPAFWALLGVVVIVALRPRQTPGPQLPAFVMMAAGAGVMLFGLADWLVIGWPLSALPGPVSWAVVVAVVGLVVLLAGAWRYSQSVQWLLPTMLVGGLLSAFWVVPFALRQDFVNDMGWEKLGEGEGSVWDRWADYLLLGIESDTTPAHSLIWVFALALAGAVLSIALRQRVGIFLAVMTVLGGIIFVFLPQNRLWNGRILPFYYLTAFLLAFLAVALVIQLLARIVQPRRKADIILAYAPVVAGLAAVIAVLARSWSGQGIVFVLVFVPTFVVGMVLVSLVPVGDVRPEGRAAAPGPHSSKVFPLLVGSCGAMGALAAVLLVVGLPLDVIPLSDPVEDAQSVETGYRWPSVAPRWLQIEADAPESVNVPKWAEWNFRGYEGKDQPSEYHEDMWAEYSAMLTTMERVGEDPDHGCGRALWEYNHETLNPYGTPMAPMLLPYWTDGCITSMEGLYFEASMTTPYHFLMQTELSEEPSSAQRYMPYGGFNMDLGVQHLQLMGVKYYMATSDMAIEAARNHPALTEIATSKPWEVFEVAGSDLVVPLTNEPAVLSDASQSAADWLEEPAAYQAPGAQDGRLPQANGPVDGDAGAVGDAEGGPWPLAPDGWSEEPPPTEDDAAEPVEHFFGPSVQWFLNPAVWDVPVAVSGPSEWQRVERDEAPEWRSVRPAEVSEVEVDRERISFEVDEPGSPVLVKMSYFPNWQASGADGPWRVAPNLMVVIPTENEVTLTYGTTWVEWLAYGLTFAGLVGLVVLASRGGYRFREVSPDGVESVAAEPAGDGKLDDASYPWMT